MKKILTALSLLVLVGCSLLHSPPAGAATITVTWTNPTTNTDNSTIADTGGESLQAWRIEYGTCLAGNAFGVKAGEFIRTRAVGGAPLTTATNNVPTGQTCVRALVANQAGRESAASNVSATVVQPSTPGPLTNVTANGG